MTEQVYKQLNETVIWHTLPNGLRVAIVPKVGFSRKMAYFVTDFGSIHTRFTLDGKEQEAPAGVAHYLEHKLFDMPDGDVMAKFAALGASDNAFTGYDMTAYHFSCTENFEKSLALLLSFVSTPYFTEESVQKEQGIIGQEIDMYEDNPDSRVFEMLMGAMYENHPISKPILGTRQTIASITQEELSLCHRAFYQPENMLLCVVGDVDPERIYALAEANLPRQSAPVAKRIRTWQEDMAVKTPRVTAQMEVAMPLFQIGFKCEPLGWGEEAVRKEIIGELAAEALFGESSALYLQLYEDGIIDTGFGGGFETVEGLALLTCSGDSEQPEAVLSAILQRAKELVKEGISREDFLRMKRSAVGRRIREMDNFDGICFRVCAYHFSGFDYFKVPQLYADVTEEEVLECIRRVAQEQRSCLSVIYPLEEV